VIGPAVAGIVTGEADAPRTEPIQRVGSHVPVAVKAVLATMVGQYLPPVPCVVLEVRSFTWL
jgi:hypothetical protein